jgi:uncharacterized protein YbjT (DUF2867 family)
MIVITEATGKVGSILSQLLLDSGRKVRLVARGEDKLKTFACKRAETFAGSLLDTNFFTQTYKGANVVFTMLPADFQTDDFKAYQEKAAEAILNAVKNSGAKHVLNLSSVGDHTTLEEFSHFLAQIYTNG